MTNSIGLLFPGQGSQSVGMGRSLYEADPHVRELYQEASQVLGYDIAALCFKGPSEKLNLTEYTQPALLVTSLAARSLFDQLQCQPSAVAGHSLGEYSAIVAAGGLSFSQAVKLVQKRGQYMSEAVAPGTGLVAAVLGLSEEEVTRACEDAKSEGVVAPANFNCPGQIVIAGEKVAVEKTISLLKERGARRVMPLPVSVPVHTPLMQVAADRLQADVATMDWSDLNVPLVNNAEATALIKIEDVRTSLIRQLPSPVQWSQSIQSMAKMGVDTFIEVGPGKVLSGLVKRILPNATIWNVADTKSFQSVRSSLAS
ncbi:ACP S-malonyltransferase [Candidatus Nitrospira salsa]